jgi:hypothetical protein
MRLRDAIVDGWCGSTVDQRRQTEERKPARRLACLAYRAKRREGSGHRDAHEAAVAAVRSVLPLARKDATDKAVNAIAYATKHLREWFWPGRSAYLSEDDHDH